MRFGTTNGRSTRKMISLKINFLSIQSHNSTRTSITINLILRERNRIITIVNEIFKIRLKIQKTKFFQNTIFLVNIIETHDFFKPNLV
jgi:hypothetical protein